MLPQNKSRCLALSLSVFSLASAVSLSVPPPQAQRVGLGGLKDSASRAYAEQKRAGEIRKRKRAGEPLDFETYFTLNRANTDLGRLVNVAWLGFYFKQWTPLALYASIKYERFPFPLELPSAFATETLRDRSRRQGAEKKAMALKQFAEKTEKSMAQSTSPAKAALLEELSAVVQVGESALRQGSKAGALKQLLSRASSTDDKKQLRELPDSVLYAASRAVEGPFKIFPRGMHVKAIESKLKAITEGDAALTRSELSELSRFALQSACDERAIQRTTDTSETEMCKHLEDWLRLAKTAQNDCPQTTVLAMLAINTASAIRADKNTPISRALSTPGF